MESVVRGAMKQRAAVAGLFVTLLVVGAVPAKAAGVFPSLKWRLPIGTGWNACPAVADLDLDGYMELLVGSTDGHLYCLTPAGRARWRAKLNGEVVSSPAIGDVDGDGSLEVVVGSMDGSLYCLTPEGETKWTYATGDAITASPVIVDLKQNGRKQILIGSQDHSLHCVSGTGEGIWSKGTDSWVVGTPAVGDLTGDGLLEIVFGSMDYGVFALRADGSEIWKYQTEGWVQSSPVIADLDSDRACETVVTSDDGNLYCLSAEGRRRWNVTLKGGEHFRGSPVVVNFPPSNALEVIAATESGTVACVSAYGGPIWQRSVEGGVVASPIVIDLGGSDGIIVPTLSGKLCGLSHYGSQLFAATLGFQAWSTPLAVDLDRDGKLELYVGIRRDEARPEGFLYQFELSTPSKTAPWRCFHGDQARTGNYRNALSYSDALARGFDYGTAWEPFARPFSAAVPQIKALARMAVADRLDDTTTGNGNGLLDGAERATLDVLLSNRSEGTFHSMMVVPKVVGQGVVIYPGSLYLGRVPPGATKRVRFTLGAPRDVPTQRATLTFSAKEAGVTVAMAESAIGVAPFLEPYLHVVRTKVDDSAGRFTSGNANGRLGTGEEALLYLTVLNSSNGTAKGLRAKLEAVDRNALVIVGGADLGDLRPAATATAKFHVRVAKKAQGDQIRFRLTMTSPGMPTYSKIAGLRLEHVWSDTRPPVLALTQPARRVVSVRAAEVTIMGYALDASGIARLALNGSTISKGATYPMSGPAGKGVGFVFVRRLELGENPLTITAADGAGNVATRYVRVIRK
jgi:outer membrane protein assembly factor BamB